MKLIDLVNNSLSDEHKAGSEYEAMAKLASKDTSLTEEERALIVGILFKIQTDEGTHKVLLSIIQEVLNNK